MNKNKKIIVYFLLFFIVYICFSSVNVFAEERNEALEEQWAKEYTEEMKKIDSDPNSHYKETDNFGGYGYSEYLYKYLSKETFMRLYKRSGVFPKQPEFKITLQYPEWYQKVKPNAPTEMYFTEKGSIYDTEKADSHLPFSKVYDKYKGPAHKLTDYEA